MYAFVQELDDCFYVCKCCCPNCTKSWWIKLLS